MRRLLAAISALLGAAAAHAATFIVNVGGNNPPTFHPQALAIQAGDTVTFINKGGVHNVVADDGSFRCAHGCDGQPGGNGSPSSSSWIFSRTFTQPGTVGYFCEIHGAPGQGMFGTLTVNAPTPVRLQSFEVD